MKLEVELLRGRTNSLCSVEYRIGFWTEQQLPQKDSPNRLIQLLDTYTEK